MKAKARPVSKNPPSQSVDRHGAAREPEFLARVDDVSAYSKVLDPLAKTCTGKCQDCASRSPAAAIRG
jgi:hypothetical protein